MKTPVNYCASYQDLTSSQSLCHMKRNSCVLNPSDSERVQQQQQMSSSSAYETAYENGFKQSDNQQAPPDTAGKKSDSTVEIERIIEKNTTDQVTVVCKCTFLRMSPFLHFFFVSPLSECHHAVRIVGLMTCNDFQLLITHNDL